MEKVFEAKWDMKDLAKMSHLENEIQRKMNIAEKKAVKAGVKELKKDVKKIYNLQSKDKAFEKRIKTKKGAIEVTSEKGLTVGTDAHFTHTPKYFSSQKDIPMKKRKKIRLCIKKGNRRLVNGFFILNPEKTKNKVTVLWHRDSDSKWGVEPLKTLSAAQMASNQKVANETIKAMQKKMSEELDKLW